MSVPIAITLNSILCAVLVAGLAWSMSRPRKLKAHVSAAGRHLSLVETEEGGEVEERVRRAA
jgi:hypothetical protein